MTRPAEILVCRHCKNVLWQGRVFLFEVLTLKLQKLGVRVAPRCGTRDQLLIYTVVDLGSKTYGLDPEFGEI